MRLRSSRNIAALAAGLICLSSISLSADKKQLKAALAAVEANLKTPAGKQYEDQIGKVFFEKYLPNVKPCKQFVPAGSAIDPFDVLLKLNVSGQVAEALVYPENQFSNCTRDAFLPVKFSAPPHDEYWINVHMEFKH